MVSEVSIAAMTIMMTATSPGTIMLRLASVSLYQTRDCAVSGSVSRSPCSAMRWPKLAATPSA